MKHLVMYSTNTRLAYMLNQKYYKEQHYVYCCPYFDASQVSALEQGTPPSSSPSELLRDLAAEAVRSDRHGARIALNKAGLRRGAVAKLAAGVITSEQQSEILQIVDLAEAALFRPLLYVIPAAAVETKIRPVPLADKAHPLSEEYIIDTLRRAEFDIIELSRS
jgi:hypothetical protein